MWFYYWKLTVNIAIGINLGLFCFGLYSGNYEIIPLSIVNGLLLSTIFLLPEKDD